jgi:hypothetical protein
MAPVDRRLPAEIVDGVEVERDTARPDPERDQAADGELRTHATCQQPATARGARPSTGGA